MAVFSYHFSVRTLHTYLYVWQLQAYLFCCVRKQWILFNSKVCQYIFSRIFQCADSFSFGKMISIGGKKVLCEVTLRVPNNLGRDILQLMDGLHSLDGFQNLLYHSSANCEQVCKKRLDGWRYCQTALNLMTVIQSDASNGVLYTISGYVTQWVCCSF